MANDVSKINKVLIQTKTEEQQAVLERDDGIRPD